MLTNVGSISVRFSELFSWTGTACTLKLGYRLHYDFKPVVVVVTHFGLCLIIMAVLFHGDLHDWQVIFCVIMHCLYSLVSEELPLVTHSFLILCLS